MQHHLTDFTTNAEGISLGRKHKRMKRPTENKPKTIKKMVTGSSDQIRSVAQSDSLRPHESHNYLKYKWIKCTNQKIQTGWVDENMCMYTLPCTTLLCLTLPNCMQLFYIVKLIMFALWFAIATFIFFLSVCLHFFSFFSLYSVLLQ